MDGFGRDLLGGAGVGKRSDLLEGSTGHFQEHMGVCIDPNLVLGFVREKFGGGVEEKMQKRRGICLEKMEGARMVFGVLNGGRDGSGEDKWGEKKGRVDKGLKGEKNGKKGSINEDIQGGKSCESVPEKKLKKDSPRDILFQSVANSNSISKKATPAQVLGETSARENGKEYDFFKRGKGE